MKRTGFLSAVLSLFLLIPASITRAQSLVKQKGLTTVTFTTPHGTIKVYLPADIRPGDKISGSIKAEPSGKNDKQIKVNQSEMDAMIVTIYDHKFPVGESEKFEFNAPPKLSPVFVGVSGIHTDITSRTRAPGIPENNQKASSNNFIIPSHALTGSPLRIYGPFDGDAGNTVININNIPAVIVAESPRQAVVSYPASAGGTHSISISENNNPLYTSAITGVDMKISAGKLDLKKGQRTYLDVNISSLAGLKDTAYLSVNNISTNVVSMKGGNNIIAAIPPSENINTYSRRFDVTSNHTGSFTINVNLSLPENNSGLSAAPLYSIKRFLVGEDDIQVTENNKPVPTKKGEQEYVHFSDNVLHVFLDDTFINEYELENPGSITVQDIMTKFSDTTYEQPSISCDSMNRLCNKNEAFNLFWGDVYSVFNGKQESRLVKGETIERSKTSSLLVTRGWEVNCCTGEFTLKLFFQAMQDGIGERKYNISFTKLLKSGNPCPVTCESCKKKCDELKK